MDKILIPGTIFGFAKIVAEELSSEYTICNCEFLASALGRNIKIQNPKVVLAFKNIGTVPTAYTELKESFPSVGLVVVCDSDDVSLDYYKKEGMVVIKKPVGGDEIKAAIEEAARQAETMKPKKSILVVDDSPVILRTIKDMLGEVYKISFATSGVKALDMMHKNEYDIVLLDYEMPGMSGHDVIKEIRNNNDIKDIPVVFLTGVAEKDKIVDVISYHPAGYILKPMDVDLIRKTVNDILDK